jgi:hypothetical protein
MLATLHLGATTTTTSQQLATDGWPNMEQGVWQQRSTLHPHATPPPDPQLSPRLNPPPLPPPFTHTHNPAHTPLTPHTHTEFALDCEEAALLIKLHHATSQALVTAAEGGWGPLTLDQALAYAAQGKAQAEEVLRAIDEAEAAAAMLVPTPGAFFCFFVFWVGGGGCGWVGVMCNVYAFCACVRAWLLDSGGEGGVGLWLTWLPHDNGARPLPLPLPLPLFSPSPVHPPPPPPNPPLSPPPLSVSPSGPCPPAAS